MLSKLYADNFRTLVNFEVELQPLSILLGDNGVGKTTVFDVIQRLQDFVGGRTRTDEAFRPRDLTRWHVRPKQTFELTVLRDEHRFTYRLVIEVNASLRKARVVEETLHDQGGPLYEYKEGHSQLYRNDHKPGPKYPFDWSVSGLSFLTPRPENTKLSAFRDAVEKLMVLRLNPMTIPSRSEQEESRLVATGMNFASWWRVLSQEWPIQVNEANTALGPIFDRFIGARLVNVGGNTRDLTLTFGPPNADNVPADFAEIVKTNLEYTFDELSDGQRVLIILYTLVLGLRGQGYTLFLDEPENYLSLREIQPWLALLRDTVGDGIDQAVTISHHPEQIDYLGPDSGIWLDRPDGGPTRVVKPEIDTQAGLKLSELVSRGWIK